MGNGEPIHPLFLYLQKSKYKSTKLHLLTKTQYHNVGTTNIKVVVRVLHYILHFKHLLKDIKHFDSRIRAEKLPFLPALAWSCHVFPSGDSADKYICEGFQSSNILGFGVKKIHISALVSSKTFFFASNYCSA